MITNGRVEEARSSAAAYAGLLVTADKGLARVFRRELRRTLPAFAMEVRSDWLEALQGGGPRYVWVAIDLASAMAPTDALRLARLSWPEARIAAISSWWSENREEARELADVVVHKPLRSLELEAFFGGVSSNGRHHTPAPPPVAIKPAVRRSASIPIPASPP